MSQSLLGVCNAKVHMYMLHIFIYVFIYCIVHVIFLCGIAIYFNIKSVHLWGYFRGNEEFTKHKEQL